MGAIWRTTPSQSEQRQDNKLNGGINNSFTAMNIKDNQSTDEYGWDTDEYPALTTRKGRSPYGLTGSAQTNLLTKFKDTHMLRAVGTTLQYDNAGTWTNITGTFTNTDWDATNFEVAAADAVILTNGTDNVKYWNGSTLADLNASAPKGKYITNDTVRVWIAKVDILYFSAFLDAQDWTTAENSGSVQYYTSDGGDITGLVNFANHIVIFKKRSMAEIFGTDYFSFKLIENSNDIGCVSFKTIQEVGDTLFWLGENDVYAYRGGKPVGIGMQQIKDHINDINATYVSKCFGGTDGTKYYLGLVTGANTEPNVLLIYDPRYQIWRIQSLISGLRYSVLFNNQWYAGDSTGLTYKMNDGTSDNGTAISGLWISKVFDEGFPEAEKEYFEMHLQGYIPTDSTLTVYVSTTDRDSSFTSVYTATADDNTQSMNIIIPLDTVPITHYFRYKLVSSGPVEIMNVQRYFRIHPVQH